MSIIVEQYATVRTKRYSAKVSDTGQLLKFEKDNSGYVYPRLSDLEELVRECKAAVTLMKGNNERAKG
jgi:hypothetical protein